MFVSIYGSSTHMTKHKILKFFAAFLHERCDTKCRQNWIHQLSVDVRVDKNVAINKLTIIVFKHRYSKLLKQEAGNFRLDVI